MNDARQKITEYLLRMERAATPIERTVAYREMMTYHVFLPENERLATEDLVRPCWDAIEKIPVPPDPILQRAEELLNRIKSRVPQP